MAVTGPFLLVVPIVVTPNNYAVAVMTVASAFSSFAVIPLVIDLLDPEDVPRCCPES